MCDRLVSRIEQVDAEVAGMMDAWKSVEEGGKSLQDASQKLLDERVSPWTHEERAAREIDSLPSFRTGWWNYRGPLGQPWSISSS
jgi:hypothetical protein